MSTDVYTEREMADDLRIARLIHVDVMDTPMRAHRRVVVLSDELLRTQTRVATLVGRR